MSHLKYVSSHLKYEKIYVCDLHKYKRKGNTASDHAMMNQVKTNEDALKFVFSALWKVVKEVVLLFSCSFSLMWTN